MTNDTGAASPGNPDPKSKRGVGDVKEKDCPPAPTPGSAVPDAKKAAGDQLEQALGKMKLVDDKDKDKSKDKDKPKKKPKSPKKSISSTSSPNPKPKPSLNESIQLEAESFEDFNLTKDLLRGIYAMGYEKPALCQKKVILPFIKGNDIICQAQSGMGKTAAFCIGILQLIKPEKKNVQAMVISPTRELAEQVAEVFQSLSQFMKDVRTITCIGGTVTRNNWEDLEKGAHIIVGTPGRVANLIKAKRMDPVAIEIFVLDEADKMILDYSFRPDLHYIISRINGDAQIMLASATMPSAAIARAKEFMIRPLIVLIPNEELTLQGIKQFFITVDEEKHKVDELVELFPTMGKKKGMIFCNTRRMAKVVQDLLKDKLSGSDEERVSGMFGTMQQSARNTAMSSFRGGQVNFLVASDLVGRGIDVQQVQVVVNYEIPERKEEYIHRVGRAGRYGRKGVAITLILNNDAEKRKLTELQEFYHTVIEPMTANFGDVFNL